MATLSRRLLQKLIRENMEYDEYGFNNLFAIYLKILDREDMLEYEPMASDSFKRLINEWSSVDSGWLIINREGIDPLYYKRCCHRNNLSRSKWSERAKKLLNGRWLVWNKQA